MAVAVAVDSKVGPGSLGAGRSKDVVDFATGYVSPISYNHPPRLSSRSGSHKKLNVLTSTKALGNASSAGSSTVSPKPNKQTELRAGLAHIDTNMTSYTTTSTIPASTTRSESRLAKLHKRTSSGSSQPATPSPLATQSQFTTPYTTYEESHASTPSQTANSSFKSRPYIRKLSLAKDDENQGRLDLSKSVSEAGYLPGLGIQDYGSRSASEVAFVHSNRRAPHARTTSGGSQVSIASRSFTPTQPFMHPMRQTPYTPSGQSYASSMNDDEAHESSDIVTDDDIIPGQPFRNRRSESISSTPHIQPTPLSQSHTPADLGYVPKYNTSQTNLSIKSGRSGKSSRSKLGRSRRNTERSDFAPDPSARASVDKAFSFVSRRSDTDVQTRDERIREKRRQFNEKEAKKERHDLQRRVTDEAKSMRKEERQARKSSISQHERPRVSPSKSSKITSLKKTRRDTEELGARSYDDTTPATMTALPRQAVVEEKRRRNDRDSGSWARFSTWLQTRLLSCGEKKG